MFQSRPFKSQHFKNFTIFCFINSLSNFIDSFRSVSNLSQGRSRSSIICHISFPREKLSNTFQLSFVYASPLAGINDHSVAILIKFSLFPLAAFSAHFCPWNTIAINHWEIFATVIYIISRNSEWLSEVSLVSEVKSEFLLI